MQHLFFNHNLSEPEQSSNNHLLTQTHKPFISNVNVAN